jgi:hypothetical protein
MEAAFSAIAFSGCELTARAQAPSSDPAKHDMDFGEGQNPREPNVFTPPAAARCDPPPLCGFILSRPEQLLCLGRTILKDENFDSRLRSD